MTKKGLIEMVQFRLAGGDTTPQGKSKYHDGMVAAFIARAFEQIFYQIFAKDRSNLDLYAKWYDGVEVVFDSARSVYTAKLTQSLVQLPESEGIRRVMPDRLQKGSMDNSYVQVKIGAEEAYSNLEAGTVTKKMMYRVIGNNLDLPFHNSNITHLSILQVVPFDKLLSTDEVYLPSGQDLTLIDLVTQMMFPKVQEDKNDVG